MKTYKVTIYPVTPWTVQVEAESEQEAKEIALDLDGPAVLAYHGTGDNTGEWEADVLEWPNIGKDGQIDIEEID